MGRIRSNCAQDVAGLRKDVAGNETGDSAGEFHPHLAVRFHGNCGAGHHQSPHYGAKQMAQKLIAVEGGIQQPGRFEERLQAQGAESG